jgi:polyhydroxyalkanoate synthesis regulator phasin
MGTGKKLLVAVVAVLVLAAAAIGGVALAQTPSSASPGRGAAGSRIDDFLNKLAQNLNIDRPTLDNALKTTAKQEVDSAVAAGRITQDQANQIEQRIENGQVPFGLGAGFGRRFGGGGGEVAQCRSGAGSAVAGALGISQGDLQQARANGESIAQIAQDHGKTVADLRTAVEDSVKSCLDQQVQSGSLTQQQEQNILQRIQNGRFPGGPGNGGSRQHRSPGSRGASQ